MYHLQKTRCLIVFNSQTRALFARDHSFQPSHSHTCGRIVTYTVLCAGFGVQALTTGEGALGSLAKFASTFAPELVEDIEQAVGAV